MGARAANYRSDYWRRLVVGRRRLSKMINRVNRYSGPPMTLGNAAVAHVRLIVWCLDCRHQVEPDPAEMAKRYGAEVAVLDWHARLVCSRCGSRRGDMVVSGTERRQ
jgi:hypothetical protein